MKKRYLLFSLGLLLSIFTSCNQLDGSSKTGNYTLKGKVMDKTSTPVADVEVSIKGTSYSTKTGADGSYQINGVGKGSVEVIAKKQGYNFIPEFSAFTKESAYAGNILSVGIAASESGIVDGANFTATNKRLTIADIQGSSLESPLKNQNVQGIVGVVTMVCHKAPHFKYDTTDLDGDTIPQWLSYDGFFMESLPEDKDVSDGTGIKSNGIFVNTHDDAYDSSDETHWLSGIPTDLQAGDVVVVNGTVEEVRHLDRFDSSTGTLTRTEIKASAVLHEIDSTGEYVSAGYPDGVLLTYTQDNADAWISGHENDGLREYRIMPFDSDSSTPMKEAIAVLESVEGMVIRIDNPIVVGSTYYNITGVLADNGKKDGQFPRTYNETWQGDVIWENEVTKVQDFNEELLFVDYQAVDWTTWYPITQNGDLLVDTTNTSTPSASNHVFRGVMDYTVDGIYMARPLNNVKNSYLLPASPAASVTPFYTRSDSKTITSVTGEIIPNQGWNFDNTKSWYATTAGFTSAQVKAMTGTGVASSKDVKASDLYAPRLGTEKKTEFDALPVFTPKWKDIVSTSTGTLEAYKNDLTVAAFNLENYEAQGSGNDKQANVAKVLKNNLCYPDVAIIVEMGDDKATPINYDNQGNSWAEKDGNVTAVRNFSGIIDVVKKTFAGPQYDFRCIDHHEQNSGGKGGVNIRVGLMYNSERIEAVDTGLPNNNYITTHGGSYSGALEEESNWAVQTSNHHAEGWALAEVSACVYKGKDGKAHLTQSPSLIHSEAFNGSRRPIVQEFKLKGTDKNFFVIGCHLGSKRGDFPLYGSVQPPLLLSENKRNRQARTVYEFVQKILDIDSKAIVVVGGDMNDFAYSTPQRILTGEIGTQILWSPVEELMPYVEQFSYTFKGNMQEIDHIFVTNSLWSKISDKKLADKKDKTSEVWKDYCFIPHINSMFTRNNHVNLSDHDPDIIHIPGAFNDD